MTDTQFLLGKLIEGSPSRDAVHIAVAPVTAGETMEPGQRAGFITSSQEIVGSRGQHIGIVDPFLTEPVITGQKCWLYLFPNTITSLHHLWTHPAFGAVVEVPADKATSEAWLRDFAERADCPGYETLIAAASDGRVETVDDIYGDAAYRNDGEYLHFIGRDAHGKIPAEFWDHVEIVTGKKITRRPQYFSCSC